MVEQIIVTFYGDMAAGGPELMDAELEQIPRLVARHVKRLYEGRTHRSSSAACSRAPA
ncbi:hypothetical protein [Nannocystis pusilla]|uniref:Uncharacterized protein n=1 Tax=Nannocystis pusilla TaxID=889268 RepID=A0ABS7U435_9BACT|nr:hypothetical protein [Nannocystis pusilla]MBZ5715319.1 hypothetical protein [Nannocystis pusilla]